MRRSCRRTRPCRRSRRDAVAVIRRSGEHLLRLIDGMLDIARIEAGKLRLDHGDAAAARVPRRDRAHVRAAGRGQGPRLPLRDRAAGCPRWCTPTKAAAPDPDQPAGQRGQVHRRGRVTLRVELRARDGALRGRSTPASASRRGPRAHLHAVRARRAGRRRRRARHRPGPDDHAAC